MSRKFFGLLVLSGMVLMLAGFSTQSNEAEAGKKRFFGGHRSACDFVCGNGFVGDCGFVCGHRGHRRHHRRYRGHACGHVCGPVAAVCCHPAPVAAAPVDCCAPVATCCAPAATCCGAAPAYGNGGAYENGDVAPPPPGEDDAEEAPAPAPETDA